MNPKPDAPTADTPRAPRAPRPQRTPTPAPTPSPSPTAPRYFARRSFVYGGEAFDREQVIGLRGLPNDEALVRLGYVAKLDTTPVRCNACGAEFRTGGALQHHGDTRHDTRPAPRPQMVPRQVGESQLDYDRREAEFLRAVQAAEEAAEERRDARDDREAPLNWENTKASREARL